MSDTNVPMTYVALLDDDYQNVHGLLALSSQGCYRRMDGTWIPLDPDAEDFDPEDYEAKDCTEAFINRYDVASRFGDTLDHHDLA